MFDARMQRAVQQESRTVRSALSDSSHSKSRRRRRRGSSSAYCGGVTSKQGGSLLILVSTIVLVVLVMTVLHEYNSMKANTDQKMVDMLRSAAKESSAQRMAKEAEAAKAAAEAAAAAAEAEAAAESASSSFQDVVVFSTKLGDIKVVLRPDLSEGSVEYVRQLVDSKVCHRCNFYRAEEHGILQGVMKNRDIETNTQLGSCPEGLENVKNDCPEWDQNCACHGPIMTRGSVAWAAGQAGGPDFFISNYRRQADWWGTQHTNFGMIDPNDEKSLQVLDSVFDQPTKQEGLTMLVDPIHFDLRIEKVPIQQDQ